MAFFANFLPPQVSSHFIPILSGTVGYLPYGANTEHLKHDLCHQGLCLAAQLTSAITSLSRFAVLNIILLLKFSESAILEINKEMIHFFKIEMIVLGISLLEYFLSPPVLFNRYPSTCSL